MRRRSLLVALALLLAALSVAACGVDEEEKTGLFEGEPVELGELRWNVLFTRFLNPHDIQDREYLVGQPLPPADASYMGVFVEIENEDDDNAQPLPESLEVEDTEHQVYESIESESPYALGLGRQLDAGAEVPALDSTPQVGTIQGSMVLFLIPDEATENRPFEITIPGQDGPATIELDL